MAIIIAAIASENNRFRFLIQKLPLLVFDSCGNKVVHVSGSAGILPHSFETIVSLMFLGSLLSIPPAGTDACAPSRQLLFFASRLLTRTPKGTVAALAALDQPSTKMRSMCGKVQRPKIKDQRPSFFTSSSGYLSQSFCPIYFPFVIAAFPEWL